MRALPWLFYICAFLFIFVEFSFIRKTFKKNEPPEKLKVTVKLFSDKEDEFQVFYLMKGHAGFSEEFSVKKPVINSHQSQTVEFQIPKKDLMSIRLDLGNKNVDSKIVINEILFEYENIYIISKEQLLDHFVPNSFMTLDTDNNISISKVADFPDPYFVSINVGKIIQNIEVENSTNKFFKIFSEFTIVDYLISAFVAISFCCLLFYFFRLESISVYNFVYLAIWVLLNFIFIQLFDKIRLNKIGDSNHVQLEVNARLEHSDIFQIFYITTSDPVWDEPKSFKVPVIGATHFQTLSVSIPDSLKITQLRLDLSQNQTQTPVAIESVCLRNNGSKFTFTKSNFMDYFTPNQWIRYDNSSELLFMPQVFANSYDPYLLSKDITSEYEKVRSSVKFPFLSAIFAFLFALVVFVYLNVNFNKEILVGFSGQQAMLASLSFVVILFLPLLKETLFFVDDSNTEKRILKSKPVFSMEGVKTYPKLYEQYFNDNFGYRKELVALGGYLRFKVFNEALVDKVAIGKNGWLFLAGDFDNITNDYAKLNLYTQEDLENKKQLLELKDSLCRQLGVKFYKASYPNTHSIYSEYLPERIRIQQADTCSRVEQVNNYLRLKKSCVEIIDTKEALLKGKDLAQLYYKYDSHWNEYGAFLGYSALFQKIALHNPKLKPYDISKFDISWKRTGKGDLINFLGVEAAEEWTEDIPVFKLKENNDLIIPAGSPYPLTEVYQNVSDTTGLVAVVFHDSYTLALKPFINRHFKKIIYCWTDFNLDIIKQEKPDLVIEGYVERYFR